MQKLQNNTLSIDQKIKQRTDLLLSLWNSWLKFPINRLKSCEFIQNAKFADLTQTTNLYTEDLFQLIFLTSMQHQITQKRIKEQEW